MIVPPSDIADLTGDGFADGEVPTWDVTADKFVPGTGGGSAAYQQVVGDGSAVTFDIVHGLDTLAISVEAWSAGVGVDVALLILDVNTVRVTFPAPPAVDDGLVVVLAAGGSIEGVGGLIQTRHDIFGPIPHTGAAMSTSGTGGAYIYPGNALTASTEIFRFDLFPERWRHVLYAEWRLIYQPNDAANGVELVHALAGPVSITQMAEFTGNAAATPTHASVEITDELNAIIDLGQWRSIGNRVKAGGSAVVLWASWLTIVWDIPVLGGGGISASSPLTTKGDVFTFDTVGARLPVGTNGQLLTADSAETTGIKWADAPDVDVETAGRWEVVVSGVPAEAVTNEADDDFLYTWTED